MNKFAVHTSDSDLKAQIACELSIMDIMKYLLAILGIFATTPEIRSEPIIQTIFEWKMVEFAYENSSIRNAELASGAFILNMSLPFDVDVYYGGQTNRTIFMTIPRFFNGTPATLGIVTNNKFNGENMIAPYPSWSWHRNPHSCNVDRILSVYRVKIDDCGRLWILDSGKIGDDQICPPQLLTFDLKTNRLSNRIIIPPHLYDARTMLINLIVDVRDPSVCSNNAFVYMADNRDFSIIVYDMRNNQTWRAIDITMYPYPSYGRYYMAGETFDLMDGVLGMDLSPFDPNNPYRDRILYYQALASLTENWVHTSFLRNQTRWAANIPFSSPEGFHTYRNTRSSQSVTMAIDRNGISYFGLLTEISINCWNTRNDYGGFNIHNVYYNPETMQYASGIKVITNPTKAQDLWTVTMRAQKIAKMNFNPNETNFRISTGSIDTILRNTNCLQRSSSRAHSHQKAHKKVY